MYVTVDKKTNELEITLPQEYNDYFKELNQILMDEFAFEPLSRNTIKQMNSFVIKWFEKKGIKLPEDSERKE